MRKKLSERLRWYRVEKRLSQTDIGRRVGCTHQTVSLIEHGKLKPGKALQARLLALISRKGRISHEDMHAHAVDR